MFIIFLSYLIKRKETSFVIQPNYIISDIIGDYARMIV